MDSYPTAAAFLPEVKSVASLRRSAAHCEGCPLYLRATQTVFGEGPPDARVMLVGEQPGDREDLEGRPFVGPAGRLLDQALARSGLSREHVYLTNAVKHFRWRAGAKRRLHDKPRAGEIRACRPWLEAELAAVRPSIIVCLGATAARALLGASFRVSQRRGELLRSPWAPWLLATVHPSSILRIPDGAERAAAFEAFVSDLAAAAAAVQKP